MSLEVPPDEPRWITEPIILAMHSQQIERYGGAHGILDHYVVRSALAKPIQRWAYDDRADIADLAAAYLVGFARSQGFSDGNKRTGVACALVFLRLNGHALHVPPANRYLLTMDVARNVAADAEVAAYLRKNL